MEQRDWTVPLLLQTSGGYWEICALHAGVKLDLFTVLADGPGEAGAVAGKIDADTRATAMLLDALAAMGLVQKQGAVYVATPFSCEFLARTSPRYMGYIIMHHHHLVDGWSRLHEAVKSGGPVRKGVAHDDNETVRESFLMGMFNLASLLAPKIAAAVDLRGCNRLLDMGGGPGTYAIHFCLANPELTAVVYDLPTTRQFAEKTIASFELTERIRFMAGDYLSDDVPAGFDAAWLSHVLHADGPEACAQMLAKAVQALNPGGRLLIQEFIMNDEKEGPLFPALFSLNMLIGTDKGQAYSQAELVAMMTAAGLSGISRLTLDLPNGAGVLMGWKRPA